MSSVTLSRVADVLPHADAVALPNPVPFGQSVTVRGQINISAEEQGRGRPLAKIGFTHHTKNSRSRSPGEAERCAKEKFNDFAKGSVPQMQFRGIVPYGSVTVSDMRVTSTQDASDPGNKYNEFMRNNPINQ